MVVGEFTQETDLVVIGGGPGGYSAAFRAAELGVQTVIVDSRDAGTLGGVCLHAGCVPSKTLLHVAETIHQGERAAQFGVMFGKPKIDFPAAATWTSQTVDKLAKGLESTARKLGVEIIQGRAHFEDSRTIALTDGTIPRIRFRRALVATGSVQKAHAELPFDGSRVLTPAEAVRMEQLPKSLLIVGNDYMALELATIFSALGAKVALASDGEAWLPEADADLVRPLIRALTQHLVSIELKTSAALNGVKGDRATIRLGDRKPAAFDCIIVTAGHIGNTRGLQLEKTKAHVNADEFIAVNDQMRSDDPRIFAAGDVTGPPLLADRALAQGRIVAEVIAGRSSVFDARAIPTAIFTDPNIAWCGFTEAEAKRQGVEHVVAKLPWGASGRAMGMGRAGDGMTKIIFDPQSKLVLGLGLVGPHACEVIAEGALAIEMGATLTDLAATIHPHPTMSELIAEASKAAERGPSA